MMLQFFRNSGQRGEAHFVGAIAAPLRIAPNAFATGRWLISFILAMRRYSGSLFSRMSHLIHAAQYAAEPLLRAGQSHQAIA